VIHGSDPAVCLDPDLSLCNNFVNDDRGGKIGETRLDDFDDSCASKFCDQSGASSGQAIR